MIFELAVLIGTVGGLSAPSWGPWALTAVRRRFGRGGMDLKSPRYRRGADAPGPVPQEWQRFGGALPALRGAPANTILAVPGLAKQPPVVRAVLLDIAEQLQIPVDSLAAVISHESRWDERAKNPLGAFGLIQLTRGAKLPGFLGDSAGRVLELDAVEQLRTVAAPYFARVGAKVHGAHPGALAMVNFVPRDFGQAEGFVIAAKGGKDAQIYAANAGLGGAAGGSKDQITVGDVYAHIAKTCAEAKGQRVAVDGTMVAPPPRLLGSAPVSAPVPSAPPPKVAPAPPLQQAPASFVGADPGQLKSSSFLPSFVNADPGQLKSSGPAVQNQNLVSADPGQLKLGPASKAPRKENSLEAVPMRLGTDPEQEEQEPTGAEIHVAGSSIRGLMLAAVEAGSHEEPIWTPIDLPQHDLRVFVLHNPLRCRVGGRWLMLGMSYAEVIQICRRLAGGIEHGGGALPPTADIVDAAWQRARAERHVLQPHGLVQQPGDGALMVSIEFANRHNDNIERQMRAFGPDAFARDYGKDWCIDPRMLTLAPNGVPRGVAEYGWRQPSGVPSQSMGPGGHDINHVDYSMCCQNLVQRSAEKISTGARVDLADVYESWFGHIDGMTAEIARFL